MSTKANAYTIADLPEIQEVAGAANTLRLQADRIEELEAENALLREFVADAVEDETAFETEWNKAARAALDRAAETGN